MREYSEGERNLLAAMGEIVLAWNSLEAAVQLCIYKVGGGRNEIDALTVNLTGKSLEAAMEIMVQEFAPDHLKPDLLYARLLFSRLIDYRNDFIHSALLLGSLEDSTPVILAQALTARKRLKIHGGEFNLADLKAFISQIQSAQYFLSQVMLRLWGSLDVPPTSERPSLPEKHNRAGRSFIEFLQSDSEAKE